MNTSVGDGASRRGILIFWVGVSDNNKVADEVSREKIEGISDIVEGKRIS